MGNENSHTTKKNALPPLFQSYEIRQVSFKNRVIVTPMCQYSSDDGHVMDWHFAHHARFSLGGVGGAMVEATAITRDGRITHGCNGIYLDSHIEGLSKITSLYHNQNIPVGIQIGHAGRKGSAALPLDGAAPLANFARRPVCNVSVSPPTFSSTVFVMLIPCVANYPATLCGTLLFS